MPTDARVGILTSRSFLLIEAAIAFAVRVLPVPLGPQNIKTKPVPY